MTEQVLFVIVGAIAVIAAVGMLLSQNAVYSALSLIVTMGCIAFLFLLLEAPFLAMIQITVYAGAIMVLFIFVIMLLGAERTGVLPNRYRWLTPVSVVLTGIFLLVAGIAIAQGGVDLQQPDSAAPQVRVVNLAPDVGNVSLLVRGQPVAENLIYGAVSDYQAVPSGEVSIDLANESGEQGMSTTVNLPPGSTQNIVIYGSGDNLTLDVVPTEVNATSESNARVVFYNANPDVPSVNLVNLGSDGELSFDITGNLTDFVLVSDLEPGEATEPMMVDAGEAHWAFVRDGAIVSRVIDGEIGRSYTVEAEQTELIALAARRSRLDNQLYPTASVFRDEANPSFGGPEAIGIALFTRYLLPFEMVSLLLLAAMVGAIVLTHKETARSSARNRSERRRVSRPLASVIAAQVGHDVTEAKAEARPALPPAEGQSPAGD